MYEAVVGISVRKIYECIVYRSGDNGRVVNESGGGNCEMSTFVPIEARGGMMLHPGPGPLAAGPGPFPARCSLPSSCSCVFLSAADTATEKSVIAATAAEISTEVTRFDTLLMFVLLPPC